MSVDHLISLQIRPVQLNTIGCKINMLGCSCSFLVGDRKELFLYLESTHDTFDTNSPAFMCTTGVFVSVIQMPSLPTSDIVLQDISVVSWLYMYT